MTVHATGLAARDLPSLGLRPGAEPGTIEAAETLFQDETVEVGIWECAPGRFPTAKAGVGEVAQILVGSATLTHEDGTETTVRAGDTVVTPDGWRGTWTVHETVRKVYTVWRTASAS